jgi:hypothetical protein
MSTNTHKRTRRPALSFLLTAAIVLTACQNAPRDVAADFEDCLTRHGVVAEDVQANLGSDGTIESLSLVIRSEGGMPYEPVLRLVCTADAEAKA